MSGATALGRVLLAGGSGLVGQALLQQLSTDPDVTELSALLRRPVPLPAGVVPLISDFEQLADHPEWFQVDTVFCALGTTIAKAGSQAAFQRVDLDYPLALARLAKAGGARHFLVVSALGANTRSRVFYNRVKGQMEQGLRDLGFDALTIAQPSVLLGDRAEFRLGEVLAQHLSWITPAAYKPVHARQVAAGLIASAHQAPAGVRVLSNTQLRNTPTP